MKQLVFWAGGLIFVGSALFLGGCSSEKTQEGKVETPSEEVVAADETAEEVEQEPSATFKGGSLETPQFKMSIKKTELIQSQGYDKVGLFVTYELENTTDDTEIVPADLFSYFLATQENDTSRVDLSNDYLFLDAFGDERYNEMVDKDNANSNALLPGKKVEVYDAYTLDNREKPVVFSVDDIVSGESLGEYKIELK